VNGREKGHSNQSCIARTVGLWSRSMNRSVQKDREFVDSLKYEWSGFSVKLFDGEARKGSFLHGLSREF
jgi:hypothetical protein